MSLQRTHAVELSRPLVARLIVCVLLVVGCAQQSTAQHRPSAHSAQQQSNARTADAPTTTLDEASLLRETAALLQQGRLAEAEAAARKAVAAAPRDASAHSLLGVVFDQQGHAAEAEREYQTALRLDPRAVAARANLGVL